MIAIYVFSFLRQPKVNNDKDSLLSYINVDKQINQIDIDEAPIIKIEEESKNPIFEQKQISLSASFFVMYLFSYNEQALFVPRGKPNRHPDIKHTDDIFEIPNSFANGLPIVSPKD